MYVHMYIYIFTILCLIHWFYWFWVLEIHIGNILHWTLLSYYTLAYLAGITDKLLHKHHILRYALHNIIVAQKWLKYDVYYTKTRCVLQNNGRYYMFLLHK